MPHSTAAYCPNCHAKLETELVLECWNCRASFEGTSAWKPLSKRSGKFQPIKKKEPYVATWLDKLFLHLVVGSLVWIVGMVGLVALVVIPSIPYGGGSVAPLYLAIPWTAMVIFWTLSPLRLLPIPYATAATLLVIALAIYVAIEAMHGWVAGKDRERSASVLKPITSEAVNPEIGRLSS